MKKWVFIPILGLILIVLFLVGGWRPILTLFGFRVVGESPTGYATQIQNPLSEWKIVVDSWEKLPNQANASVCYQRMDSIAKSWDSISPPSQYREYHSWVSKAMDYETEAFRMIANAPPNKLADIREDLVQLWTLKDEALFKADKTLPK